MSPKKIATCIISHRPSVVSRVLCPVCRVSLLSHVSIVLCVFVLYVLPMLPDSDKKVSFFVFSRWPQNVLTQGDFCAVP